MHRLDHQRLKRIVERLLAPWDRPGGPGMTLGLVVDDALAVHHSTGLASIELDVPIGPGTTFRIASVSKQFTCAAILLLAADGKLRVTDPVGDWLPGLPDIYRRITLDHLMRNTSGIRDMLEIMRAGGVDLSQPCTQEDLLDGVCRQRALNFVPGSRFLYSNSNFMLLGQVAEKASGTSLREFLDNRVFRPLGMNATRHAGNTTEPVPGLATGYFPEPEGGWRRAVHHFPIHGEGGLVSCVEDLALWHHHLGSAQGRDIAAALAEPK
ncbi:MAG: serine hydrolase domain-containing protein, partial [Acetobacteraceae bacterium]